MFLTMPEREPFSDDEKLEADLLAEDFTGKAMHYGSTAEAIAALEKRVTHLNGRKAALIEKAAAGQLGRLAGVTDANVNELIAALNSDLAKAETDLARYRQQQKARN